MQNSVRTSLVTASSFSLATNRLAISTFAVDPFSDKYGISHPDITDISKAAWAVKEVLADAGRSNHMSKDGMKPTFAAHGAEFLGEDGTTLTESCFDNRNSGLLGADALRYSDTVDVHIFLGYVYGDHTPSLENPANRTGVRFGDADTASSTGELPG